MTDLRLASLRTLRGWRSRAAYAQACGLSGPTCWRIESGCRHVRESTLARYGRPLGLAAREVERLRPSDQADLYESRPVLMPVDMWERLEASAAAAGIAVDALVGRAVRRSLEHPKKEETR